MEETARVGKREVKGGTVRVRTVVDTVEELARAELQGEKVEVTRVPVDREIDRAPEIRTEDGVTIIPVVEEVLVVEKRLVLKEELHVRRQHTHRERRGSRHAPQAAGRGGTRHPRWARPTPRRSIDGQARAAAGGC